MYACFGRSADALFELTDALIGESAARSLPELSLSPNFRRQWSSVYEALEDGQIDQACWSRAWAKALLEREPGAIWISVDATSIPRPEAETSPDRGVIYLPNLPHASKPISVGWQFSTLMLLPQERSSWGAILSQSRIGSDQSAVEVAIGQLESLRPFLPTGCRLLADRWYATGPFVIACQRLGMQALLRCKRNRKLYRPPVRRSQFGRAPLDGPLFQGSRQTTWGQADQEWEGRDEQGHCLRVQAWHQLHFRQARQAEVSVYRIVREGAKGSKRDPGESWFVGIGDVPLPLSEVASTYRHRFSHEHTYRFLKQDLFWTKVRVRTPEQFERWSLVVATAMNHLVLARECAAASYRPWERRTQVVTPRQVRRVMPAILQQLGTPTQQPKPRGKSPGRKIGARIASAVRHEVVRKPKPVPKKRQISA